MNVEVAIADILSRYDVHISTYFSNELFRPRGSEKTRWIRSKHFSYFTESPHSENANIFYEHRKLNWLGKNLGVESLTDVCVVRLSCMIKGHVQPVT